jgi:hypothetical protein
VPRSRTWTDFDTLLRPPDTAHGRTARRPLDLGAVGEHGLSAARVPCVARTGEQSRLGWGPQPGQRAKRSA